MLIDQTELVQRTPICAGLSPATLTAVLADSEIVDVAAGGYFFREGDVGECLYVICSGSAVVQRLWEDKPIVLARVGQGDCFGEMSLIDLQHRFSSVRAKTDCQAIRVPFTALCRLCQTDVEQYVILMMNLSREGSRRLRIAGDRLFRYQQELGQHGFDDELNFGA